MSYTPLLPKALLYKSIRSKFPSPSLIATLSSPYPTCLERVMEAFFRLQCNSPLSPASTGDGTVEITHGEPGEHCGMREIGNVHKTKWKKAMDAAASPSRWGSIPRAPSNDPDDFTAYPARKASYAHATIATTAAACNADCDNGVPSVEVLLDAGMISDNCGNNECIRLERRGVFEVSSPRIYGGEDEKQSTMMSMLEFDKGGSCNGSYIDSSSSSAAIENSIVISPEDWRHVAEAMLDHSIS